ncbi:MAG: HPr family phosphocarrier protein [Kiritimatiellae bacterium]|nr:HPr family phosphocarrier protein [Kiritimatiellia bacterium]
MVEMWATVENEAGIHCRPSAEIVKAAKPYEGEIFVSSDTTTCDPRSALALMSMGLAQGAKVKISVSGPDEEAFCKRLAELFQTRYDFPPRKEGEEIKIPPELQ